MSKGKAGILMIIIIKAYLIFSLAAKGGLDEEPTEFIPHETKYTKVVKGHYLKNNFFFFVGCICAIMAGTKEYCLWLIYAVIGLKFFELIGLSIGFLWLCYGCHLVGAVVNYINIITAIKYYVNEENDF